MSEARLLLVDDDVPHLDALAARLADDGFAVDPASRGAKGLEPPDPAGAHLVLSAIDAADSKADLIARFAEDYVAKPYEYVELVARIRRALRRLQDQLPVEEL